MAFIPGPREQPEMQRVAFGDSSPMSDQPQSMDVNTGSPGSQNEDGHNKGKEVKVKKGHGKPRRKFTEAELDILNYTFEENPYPNFITRKQLAEQIHCQIYVIDNWFQNKRARLPSRDKKRISAAKKRRLVPNQSHSGLSVHDLQAGPLGSPEQTCSSPPDAIPGGAGYLCPQTQWAPRQQVGLGDTVVPDIAQELSCGLEGQGDMGSGLYPNYPFSSYESAISFYPSTSSSGQYIENYGPGPGDGWDSRAPVLQHVSSVQGERQQQLEQACGPYSLCQGPQHNADVLDSSLSFSNIDTDCVPGSAVCLNPGGLGQQMAPLQSQQQGGDCYSLESMC